MDSFDQAILRHMQQDSRISTESLGASIGLSASACQRRIKKLKSSGVIQGEVALLDASQLAGFVTLILDITLKQGGNQELDFLMTQLKQEEQVQQLYYTAGDTDLVAIVTSPNMQAFDQFSRRLLMGNDNVQRFTSKVVIKTQKMGVTIPV